MDAIESFNRLRKYCESENYKGWDPFDGLNSRVFRAIPGFAGSALMREIQIQAFKRLPFNLRRMALIEKDYNAKGIGLFLQGYCNLIRIVEKRPDMEPVFGTRDELAAKVDEMAHLLLSLRSPGDWAGACWGYNFDWQARGGLFFPAYTPTVVATNFCATALMDAYEVTGHREYLDIALTSARFVLDDLHRHECRDGFLFSYSKLPGNDTVFNASILGSRLLAYCYKYTGIAEYRDAARASVAACCAAQNGDGSWIYGLGPTQKWIDSFHTGYNLDGLAAYCDLTGDNSFRGNIDRGFKFYIDNFFENDGAPKYYHNKKYPVDIHCPGQLFVTLHRLRKSEDNAALSGKVLDWTTRNMQDAEGYFYYQLKRGISSRIPYMRWSNAFMFSALTYYLLDND